MQTIKDKTVIVVEIFPGAERPYYIKSQGVFDGTYVRVAGSQESEIALVMASIVL